MLEWTEIYRRLGRDRGDAQAWVALQSWVTFWARKGLRDLGPEIIEDLVAETALRAVLAFEKAYGPETFAGFVYGHYLNVRQQGLRQHLARPASLDEIDVPAEPVERVDPYEAALLRECLEGLRPRERRAVELRYGSDASAERIAAELGVTIGNARRIVFNGLKSLRDCALRVWPDGR